MVLNQCHISPMKRFSLRLTEAEYIKLKTYCTNIHLSMNDVVRQLIREWSPNSDIVGMSIQRDQNEAK